MDNTNQIQTLEPGETVKLDCAPPCNGAVCIPRKRYDELIRAEMEREILFHAYQQMSAFSMEPVLDSIFNPKFKHQNEAGAGNKAGVGDAE